MLTAATKADVRFITVGAHADAISKAAQVLYWCRDVAVADLMLRELRTKLNDLVRDVAPFAAEPVGPVTYIVQTDGYLRETELGLSREAIVADIANGEYEASRVLRMQGGRIEDVTDAIAAEVLAAVKASGEGRNGFIPSFLTPHLPNEAEDLRQSWMSPAQRRADWEDANADRLRDERSERVLEAAE